MRREISQEYHALDTLADPLIERFSDMRDIQLAGAEADYVTVEDYLQIEEISEERHEYVAGVLFAMAGGTKRHNRIISNLVRQMLDSADAIGCEVYSSDVKLRTASDVIYYPDIIVSCDPEDTNRQIVDRPCLVIEVLSPSTRRTDEREKLISYRAIRGLQAYIIVDQDMSRVIRHWWDSSSELWNTEIHIDGDIPVPCLHTLLPVEAIYRNLPGTDEPEE